MSDIKLDVKGFSCPMPIVRVSQEMRKLIPGQTIEVQADDPAFEEDIKAYCQMTNNILEEFTKSGGVLIARLKKV